MLWEKNEPKRRRIQASASALLLSKGQSSQKCTSVINKMNVDDVSYEVKNDPLICEFGERLLEKHGSDLYKDGYVSQRKFGRRQMEQKRNDPPYRRRNETSKSSESK